MRPSGRGDAASSSTDTALPEKGKALNLLTADERQSRIAEEEGVRTVLLA